MKRNKELYNDWFGDNAGELRAYFCEEHQDEFDKYCEEQFRDWRDTLGGQ